VFLFNFLSNIEEIYGIKRLNLYICLLR